MTWNAGAERAFGYTEAEMIGKTMDVLLTEEDRSRVIYTKVLEEMHTHGKWEEERWYLRKNGTTFYGSGVMSMIGDDPAEGYVKVIRDMTGTKRLDAERDAQLLREKSAREAIQIASDMKDEFLAIMSHELKHPLNLINVNAELLVHMPEVRGLPTINRLAHTIRRAVFSQAKIIDDLLDLSRARTGKLTLQLESVLLSQIITPIVEAGRSEANQKSIAVEWSDYSEPLVALCDVVRIEQIIWNLLTNAIRYTPTGGLVRVKLGMSDGYAEISVTDSGDGIAPDELESVFGLFAQGTGGRTNRSSGLGIGLALVRELTEAHGGRVVAQSAGIGKGSTFSVFLPLSQAERTHTKTRSEEVSLENIRILAVDDSIEALDTFAQLLRVLGAQVEAATSGVQALQHLAKKEFDLLISDIGMPQMDGYELAAAVRQHPTASKLPLIALTGYGQVEDEQRVLSHEFNAYLSKPVSLDELKKVIARMHVKSN